ncbi:ThiF family adenylyltransferase (plasmid) [Bradyrhizobium sp. 62B]|uniref:HesA/MoeB/ThiF family protein n=1 Tax=Bradyrhizobium sp. 62B TaxID=2898442 RepID=UPI002557DC22|nr:ThiF family adenylyltransferase [Bradyrhizobium sp. 62B]
MSRLDRQSFLGPNSDAILDAATIGIVGLGGGGSHLAQQSAHMGIGGYVNADPDIIEDTNTNRLIGGTLADVVVKRRKVDIAERLIRGLVPNARIISAPDTWLTAADDLKLCDVIIGAVDGFQEREQLERFARRHLIPYIDIGMDVHDLGKGGFLVSGQVILSMPGCPCMRCCGFITDERLAQEAKKYGAAGSRPQVVWSNGVLASTAMGLLTQILTPWYPDPPRFVYLDYDGNKGTIIPNKRMTLLKDHVCPHHPPAEAGDPLFDVRTQSFTPRPVTPAERAMWWRRLWNRLLSAFA